MRTLQEHDAEIARLRHKLKAAEEDRAAFVERLREERARQIEMRLPELLALLPDHDRTSCSDENTANSYNRGGHTSCRRCTALEAQRGEYWPSELDLEIVITETAT